MKAMFTSMHERFTGFPPLTCLRTTVALFALGMLSAHTMKADTLYSGAISGVFTTAVFSGYSIDTNGSKVFENNGSTAVLSGFGSNAISYGDGSNVNIITFSGVGFTSIAPGQVFELGTLTYHNGTILTGTEIFGATLTLSVSDNASIDPAVSNLTFVATYNRGVPRFDADFIGFDVFPVTFNVLEGSTATAELFGRIVGDPQLQFTGVRLAADQQGAGFLGHGQPNVPDNGDTALLLTFVLSAFPIMRLRLLRRERS